MVEIWNETKKALKTMKDGQIVMQVKGAKLIEPVNDLFRDSNAHDWTSGGGLKKNKGRR